MIDPRTILVIKLKHIGDVLLGTPAIHALKAAYPAARIHALVSRGTEEMLAGNPDPARVIPLARPRGGAPAPARGGRGRRRGGSPAGWGGRGPGGPAGHRPSHLPVALQVLA